MKTPLALLLLAACATANAAEYHCEKCEQWNQPQAPFRVFGNTWFVGTTLLSSILITSPEGHVLIDGALPQSAPQIIDNIRQLGFRIEDVKLIVNSHAHFDHAGGIAELAEKSGAPVAAGAMAAARLRDGNPDDPQFGKEAPFPTLSQVREVRDGETLHAGAVAITAHATPGHTSGSTSWTWKSCEGKRCLDMVYADSITAPGYRLIGNAKQPDAVAEFTHTFEVIAALPCDILLTPHPDASDVLERLAKREAGEADAMVDRAACRNYVATMKKHFDEQLAKQRTGP